MATNPVSRTNQANPTNPFEKGFIVDDGSDNSQSSKDGNTTDIRPASLP
jgi:hypothetical protein